MLGASTAIVKLAAAFKIHRKVGSRYGSCTGVVFPINTTSLRLSESLKLDHS